jgi:hypothetical protein
MRIMGNIRMAEQGLCTLRETSTGCPGRMGRRSREGIVILRCGDGTAFAAYYVERKAKDASMEYESVVR